MITNDVIDSMIGADALDAKDDRIGEVSQVYVDEQTDHPTWVSVRLGLLRGAEVLVPLEDAEWDERVLRVAVVRSAAREAPRKEVDEALTVEEEERLYTHYGIPGLRRPRSDLGRMKVDADDVCYSVHEELAEAHQELKRAS
jgi:hypothetical protein